MNKLLSVALFSMTYISLLSAQDSDSLIIKQVDSLIQVSRNLTSKNDFEKALEVNAIAEKLALEKFDSISILYGSVCFNRARVSHLKGDIHDSEVNYLKVKFIQEKVIGRENSVYALTLNHLGLLYSDMDNYEKAEIFLLEALAIRKRVIGKQHIDYAKNLNNLGRLYCDLGKFEKAEPFNLEAKLIIEEAIGKDDIEYVLCLTNLGLLYSDMGNYEKAEPYYLESKSILEKITGRGNSKYNSCLNDLANLYMDMGVYEKAEPLYLDALSIQKETFGKENRAYARILNDLAILYKVIGNFEKAEQLYLEAKSINEKVLGKESRAYAGSANNLAILYNVMGNYKKAELLHIEAKNIREKLFGIEHPSYASSLNNLAILYEHMGQYNRAEPLLVESKDIREKLFGSESPYYGMSLNNLACLYMNMNDFEKAEPLFIEVLSLYEKTLGVNHPYYSFGLYNLGQLYTEIGNFSKAELFFTKALNLKYIHISRALQHLSQHELQRYLLTFGIDGDNIISSVFQSNKTSNFVQLCFDMTLFFKGFLLNAINNNENLILANNEVNLKYQLLKAYGRQLSAEYSKPILERKGVTDLEEKSNLIEKELAQKITGYGKNKIQVKWIEVQQKLDSLEAAIEFVHFNYYNKGNTDSIIYVALILLPNDSTPHFLPLFEERELNQLISISQSKRMDYVAEVYHSPNDRGTLPQDVQTKSLYELIWKPIEPYLKGVNKIYFSPSGLLHRINQNAIAINDQSFLSDKYDLVQLGSTRQLVTNEGNAKSIIINACIYGGINFEMDSTAVKATHHEIDTNGIALRSELSFSYTDSTLRGGSWNYLNGSEQEANEINKIIHKAGIKSSLFKGNDATEEAFKKLGDYKTESPQVIHISTHGYFFPDPKISRQSSVLSLQEEPVFKISEHPMLRSGLIMAGANHAWKTGKPITPEAEDGILTAYEISQLNLRITELVVLSACETGLGDIQGNEGVYGLQRAFKIAGAKNLIMSLWQVPDQQTSELMTAFYKYWLIKKKSIRESLKLAQNDLRKKGLESFYWAGFVLVE